MLEKKTLAIFEYFFYVQEKFGPTRNVARVNDLVTNYLTRDLLWVGYVFLSNKKN